MSSAAATAPAAARATPSPWFRSAPFDLLLILGVPFVTWPLVVLAKRAWGPELLTQLILLTATGHYFATFVRTYGDRALFERFRTRFLVAPVVLLVTCVGMFATGHGAALLLATMAWAFWHWLAQAFGFARIYDIKVGSYRKSTTYLDRALVITGFVGAVVLNDGATAEFAKTFLNAGVPLPTAGQFRVIELVTLAAMAGVGVAYVGNLAFTIARREPWSWQKQFMHVTTIGYYWFAFAWLPNVLVAYVLYELFHDIQYYAITWLTCRSRVQRPGVTRWLDRMFRPGWVAALGFIVLMSALGGVDALGRYNLAPGELGHQLWLGLFLTFALLHYYYDGFIWKARENTLGTDLGLRSGLRAAAVPTLRHAGGWAFFFVPLFALVSLEQRPLSARERAEALVALAPGDFLSQAELGLALMEARELPASLEHYRASIALNPDLAQVRANYGAALDFTGDLEGARAEYEAALALPDHGAAHRQAHVNLGVLLLAEGDPETAEGHLAAGRALGGDDPVARLMALAAALPPEAIARREKLYAAVVQLDRDQLDARFRLATLMLEQRRFREAAAHFEYLVRARPNIADGMIGLANAQAELGEFTSAEATLRRALQLAPNDPTARELARRLGL
jgi:Tfp pilus assembly protein PilF